MSSHLNLDPDEKVLLLTRRYFLTLWHHLFISFVLIVMPFFLMFPLFSWGRWGIALFIYCIAVGVMELFKTYVMWHFNTLMITNKRVVKTKQKGFFDRKVFEMPISRINDVSHHIKGVWGTMFRYGTLHIVAGNGETILDFAKMKNPERALRILNSLLQEMHEDWSASAKAR